MCIDKAEIKQKLSELINRYNNSLRMENHSNISEETIRTWLNEFLGLFGWDVQNTNQILQERFLRGRQRQRLQEIQSPHRKPDYILLNGSIIKSFVDAKSLDVNIFADTDAAYQIRSYGWSAQAPCAFVSNFEQFVIYDTRFIPQPGQPAHMGAKQFFIDDYIENFDLIFEHLWRDNICSNHLEELYAVTAVEGRNRVDSQFMNILSDFRKKLAENLYSNNSAIIQTDVSLNYYTQVILDRVVFIRVCESKGIEEQEKLKHFAQLPEGFWNAFKNSCYMEFYNHYDGAMFARDESFQQLQLNNENLMEFIDKLYYPFPYRFDVIPVKVIANIYEEFLGKQLIIENGTVRETTKEEYVRSNGAVATPEHIVDMICKQTLDLCDVNTIDELLEIKILDPCCGSGVFIVSCYEHLASKMLHIFSDKAEERDAHADFYCIKDGQYLLTIIGRRAIVTNCIYAVDSDEAAIEVTKMSLALKIVDGNNPLAWEGIGAFGDKALREIADNIKLGNTLVDIDRRFTPEQVNNIKPFSLNVTFNEVFTNHGGFSYIIGNPPYVETKYYKAAQPVMHAYLSEKYYSFEGKADLAVLFIERCLRLLNENGKLGFVIQRRWFRTEYGSTARLLINSGKHLKKLIDFKATDIFKGRIVYASIMILSNRPCENVQYYYMPSEAPEIKTKFENSNLNGHFEGCVFLDIPSQEGTATWAFDSFAITQIKSRLAEQFGILSGYPHLAIKDGIQALWKKMYHLSNVHFENGVAVGQNGFRETVRVEEGILRGVIYNRVFYPFKNVEPDAYCIFPYEGATANAIPFSALQHRYPLAYEYLSQNEGRIKGFVECRAGDLWHTFTREHNQTMYYVDKIIIPMTARDTIATFIPNKGLYMDNANVWFISVAGASHNVMKAITCIINSTIFSVLGKAGANPQSGGYYKFNKQFLAPIPFPSSKITDSSDTVNRLASLHDEIMDLQSRYIAATPAIKDVISHTLTSKWDELDNISYELYEITDDDKALIISEGRTINRIELLNGVN